MRPKTEQKIVIIFFLPLLFAMNVIISESRIEKETRERLIGHGNTLWKKSNLASESIGGRLKAIFTTNFIFIEGRK